MIGSKELFSKIKNEMDLKSDVELAEALNVKYETLRSWYQRNSIPCELVVDFAHEHKIDLNYLFGRERFEKISSPIDILNQEQKKMLDLALKEAFQNNHINEFTTELERFYFLNKIQKKIGQIDSQKSFWNKLIFGQRLKNSFILILGKVLSSFGDLNNDVVRQSITEENAKEKLIKLVEGYQLSFLSDKMKHFLLESEKNDLLEWIQTNLSDFDAYLILKNVPEVLNILREEINTFNKNAF